MKTILLFITFVFCALSCTVEEPENDMMSKSNMLTESGDLRQVLVSEEFPVGIERVYFQSWTSGVRGGGSGVDFYIKFKTALPKQIVLEQVSFREKKEPITQVEETLYLARFLNVVINPVNESETLRLSPISGDKEVLEYFNEGIYSQYILTEIEEDEVIFYQ